MIKRAALIDPELLLTTPEIEQLQLAAALDSGQQPALDRAVQERKDAVLDVVVEGILANVNTVESVVFDPKVEAAIEQLKFFADFLVSHFSESHSKSGIVLQRGVMMSDACRRRGPLVQVARALLELVPTSRLMEYAHDVQVVKIARAAREERQRTGAGNE